MSKSLVEQFKEAYPEWANPGTLQEYMATEREQMLAFQEFLSTHPQNKTKMEKSKEWKEIMEEERTLLVQQLNEYAKKDKDVLLRQVKELKELREWDQKQISSLKAQLDFARGENKDLKERLELALKQVNLGDENFIKWIDDFSQTKDENKTLKEEISQLLQRRDQEKQAHDTVVSGLRGLNDKLDQAEEEIKQLKESNVTLHVEVGEKEEKIDRLNAYVGELQHIIRDINERITKINKEKQAQQRSISLVQGLGDQAERQAGEISQLKEEKLLLTEKCNEKTSTINFLKERQEEMSETIRKLYNDFEDLQNKKPETRQNEQKRQCRVKVNELLNLISEI